MLQLVSWAMLASRLSRARNPGESAAALESPHMRMRFRPSFLSAKQSGVNEFGPPWSLRKHVPIRYSLPELKLVVRERHKLLWPAAG